MKFIALPVNQGDAFYAETDDGFRVLVDGGRSRRALPKLFRKYTKSDRVDVLVCTHNDADHAQGLIGFLENGSHCDELWIPATWLYALLRLPANTEETLDFLRERIANWRPRGGLPGLDIDADAQYWQVLFSDPQREMWSGEGIGEALAMREREQPTSLDSLLEEVLPALDEHNQFFRFISIYTYFSKFVMHILPQKTSITSRNFFDLLYLTTINREITVFYLESGNIQSGILFTADSDLQGMNLQGVPDGSIATAPHHGSKDNRDAYARIGRPMVWVRSDGYSRSRPCDEYLKAPGRRYCTMCRNSGRPKQAVRLYARAGDWVHRVTRPCECG
jgi:hypothetical protein